MGIRCVDVGVGKCQSEDSFVCFGVNPHKGLAYDISHETGRGRGKKGPRERSRTEKWTQLGSLQKSEEVDVRERRLLEPVDSEAELPNVRG